jgi:aryl-alcohol dehydrogenase-like predicted oxidoreductase
MDYTQLGRSGLRVSKLILGTMNFGPVTPEDEAWTIADLALERGINAFDTANTYGWGQNKGWTEEILGRWFATGGGRRERVVLATKVYGAMSDWPNDGRLSARNIRHACEASLRRLQTDYVDVYQMHHVDRDSPWEEIWQAMETLVVQGKVLYVGSSNFAGWHIAQAQEAARSRHFQGLVSEQALYNLAERSAELEVLPAARAYGLGVIPWSPLHGGALGGLLAKEHRGRSAGGRAADYLAGHRDRVEGFEALCGKLGEEPANVALAWLLHQDGISAPIIGPRTSAQLESVLPAATLALDESTLERLNELFPGPGTAPEAYAW